MIRSRRYAFQRHGPKRLTLRFNVNVLAGTWGEVAVRVDAMEIGRTNRDALVEGVEYTLFDHSVLRMWLESPPSGPPFLNITRNGHPLPGSGSDPLTNVRGMLLILWVFAGLQVLAEAIVIIPTDLHHNHPTHTDRWVLGVGLVVILLGILAWHRSLVALIAACALFLGQIVVFLALHPYPSILLETLIPMIGLMWCMARAIKSLAQLKSMTLPVRRPPYAA